MPIGDEVKVQCRAPDTAVTVRSMAVRLDFTGHCTARETAGARLDLLDVLLVAELPDAGGAEDGGTVTLSGDNRRLTAVIDQPGSRTEATAVNPPALTTTGEPTGPIEFVLTGEPETTPLRIETLVLELEHSR